MYRHPTEISKSLFLNFNIHFTFLKFFPTSFASWVTFLAFLASCRSAGLVDIKFIIFRLYAAAFSTFTFCNRFSHYLEGAQIGCEKIAVRPACIFDESGAKEIAYPSIVLSIYFQFFVFIYPMVDLVHMCVYWYTLSLVEREETDAVSDFAAYAHKFKKCLFDFFVRACA